MSRGAYHHIAVFDALEVKAPDGNLQDEEVVAGIAWPKDIGCYRSGSKSALDMRHTVEDTS